MTDRELLERSARAVGIVGSWEKDTAFIQDRYYFNVPYDHHNMLTGFRWNPLAESGEALRLAVRLGMVVQIDIDAGATRVLNEYFEVLLIHLHVDGGAESATRKAIVRAAASMAPEGVEAAHGITPATVEKG